MNLDLTSMENALVQLEQIAARSRNQAFMSQQDDITCHAIRAGTIQHFEVVYEMCWKFMQRWLRENYTPEEADYPRTRKELFRLAARYGLISDPLPWFGYAEARNLTIHTYNEKEAEAVYAQIEGFTHDARFLWESLRRHND